ncbi:MAG: hypothetical protein ACYCVL_09425 [Gemmatimonadaceae bacterium]
MSYNTSNDAHYLDVLLEPMRLCASYKPAFGKQDEDGVSLSQFRALYGADPLYHWVGLDSDLMYAAHKAAGGMTSIYRQLGIGCERLIRAAIRDTLELDENQVAWSYEYVTDNGKKARLTLDARIDVSHLKNQEAQARVLDWLKRTGTNLHLPAARIKQLRGAVFEVRQGYKSADSKRQNADLRFGMRATNENYLPVVSIVSTQASQTVCKRYSSAQILVLLGTLDDDTSSTFSFFKRVVGYDLAAFFERNSPKIKKDFRAILGALLSPA